MDKIVYHGTNCFLGEKVELKPHYGRFGTAVYFGDIESAQNFGKYIYKKEISDPIFKIKYRDLIHLDPDLSIDEEEGLTNLKELLEEKGVKNIKYVEIEYDDKSYEIMSYSNELVVLIKT